MTIAEYLSKNISCINKNIPIELKDIIDNGQVYCGKFNDLINLLYSVSMEHIKNARYVAENNTNDCNTILYVKDIKCYTDFDLMQLADKLQGSEL